MYIAQLQLENFRNYAAADVSFDRRVNLVVGENAQGKTNLLEAVGALSTMKLFRTGQKREGIRFGCESGRILGKIGLEDREMQLELRLHAGRSAEFWRNGVRQKRQADGVGLLRTVLFCPDDLLLIRAGAAARRRFLDTALCQLRPRYGELLAEYERVTAHKLRILKDSEEKPALLDLLEDFTARQCRLGAAVIRYRAYYVRRLAAAAARIHAEAAPGETLTVSYRTDSGVADPLGTQSEIEAGLLLHAQQRRAAEIAAGSCLVGPHKDDLTLMLNGVEAAAYASQGQTRTAALALKLAERELFFEEDGDYPVLLLDDVLSELDRRRQDFVLNRLGQGQVILTSCEADAAARFGAGQVLQVSHGTIQKPSL